jgi:hypothetical protein
VVKLWVVPAGAKEVKVPSKPRVYLDNPSYLRRRAGKQYRAAKYDEAATTLRRWDKVARLRTGSSDPVCLGLLALGEHKLGRKEAGRAALARLADLMLNDWCARDAEAKRLFGQARKALGEPAESSAVEAVKQAVMTAEQAGSVRHDLRRYMELWTADYRVASGRGEAPGPYDIGMDRAGLEARQQVFFFGPPGRGVRFTTEDFAVRVRGNRAELRSRTVIHFPGGHYAYGVLYRLRETSGGWKVYAGRWWPVGQRRGGQRTVFDAARWKALDAEVERRKERGDLRGQVRALQDAYRFAEGYRAALALTARPRTTAQDWVLRADLAFYAGKLADVAPSLRRARALEPGVEMGGHLRSALELAKRKR